MPDPLSDVLATEDDFDLCNGLFNLLLAHHGEAFDPTATPVEHRTVLLVWLTNAVIDSQGFNGFFAKDLSNDPDYRHMRAAYEAVGCEPAAGAVRKVFDAFPGRTPPADPRARVQMFGKANHAVHGALNRDFIKAREPLTAALARYIREHADAFAGVDRPGARPAVKPVARPNGNKPDPVELGAPDLPRWAKVAFHARCARQVLHLWEEAWPDASREHHDAVEQAVVLAEMCAAEGKPVGDLRAAAANATHVAEAAVADPPGGPAPARPVWAGLIAAAAGSSIDLISGVDDGGAYPFAKVLVREAELDDLMEDIQDDFLRVRDLARDGGWTDETPVPPDVFNPAYKPKKTWWKVW
jgi:hypothetical protein